jgi:ATP-binding cassette subfamily B protein
MASGRYTQLTLYRRLLLQARPYWTHIAGALLLNLATAPLALLTPLPMKLAVDSVIGSQPMPGFVRMLAPRAVQSSNGAMLVFLAALVLGFALLRQIQGVLSWVLYTYTAEGLLQDFRAKLFRHVQRLSLSYHDSRGTSDSTYRIQYDAYAIQGVTLNSLIPMITSAFTLVGMVVVIARIDWQLALVALGVAPVLYLLSRTFREPLRVRWQEIKRLDSSAMSVVTETLGAVRVVKAFGREDHEHARFIRQAAQRIAGQVQVAFFQSGFELLVGMTTAVGTALTLVIGLLHVQSGALTLGSLLIIMAYLAQLYSPLSTLSKLVTDLQSSLASAERAFALFDELPEVIERPDARPLARCIGAVSFRDVSFSYDAVHPVLEDVTFEVPAGSRVGISGTTGAGKTTLVSLLTRFYDPSAGGIALDGVDLRDYKLADLRNQFAFVLQEPVLFAASIAENIAYARPDATEAEIIEAAKLADAHDFIVALPQGYRTAVGERGMRLSGGERQRISLARAFLKNAPILILDEPTSSVDMETESAILEAMNRLMQGRTCFLISHRPAALVDCDMRLVISNRRVAAGDLVDDGSLEADLVFRRSPASA